MKCWILISECFVFLDYADDAFIGKARNRKVMLRFMHLYPLILHKRSVIYGFYAVYIQFLQ